MNTNYFFKQSTKKVVFLILVIPVIIQLFLINLVQDIEDKRLYYLIFMFFGLLYLPYFYWLNKTINFLYIHHSNKFFELKLNHFKISLIFNIMTLFNMVFFAAYIFSFVYTQEKPDIQKMNYIIFIQFIGVLSFAYSSYFICKLITTIELKRKVYFTDISGKFIIYTFPPMTIWILQNKVKGIISSIEKKYI